MSTIERKLSVETQEDEAMEVRDVIIPTAETEDKERKFRMLVEQAGDGFLVEDIEHNIFDVNERACQMLGYSRDELLAKTIPDVSKRMHRSSIEKWLEPGQFITFESMWVRKDGSTFPVSVRLGRMPWQASNRYLALVRDISEEKQAKEQLNRALLEITELKDRLERENIHLRKEIELTQRNEKILGESEAIKKVLEQAQMVAKAETNVLIQGETGTGKELLAKAIHNMSSRKDRIMLTTNCAALPPSLIESELFGREKGAYTGALTKQLGRFEVADGSTLFLDEIGDLPIELQTKLLRIVEYGQFERLGSSKTISVDVRIVAATNRDIATLVNEGKFRSDLYYRLSTFPIIIPPLRERQEDIPLLVWAFVKELEGTTGKSITNIPQKYMDALRRHSWPGNIRELRNVIERAMILSSSSTLNLAPFDPLTAVSAPNGATLDEIQKKHILQVLHQTKWLVSGRNGAAQLLGLKESTLRAKMARLKIKRPK